MNLHPSSAYSETASSLAIFPGSFDPLTNGHLDLIERASRLFEQLIVAVLTNTQKNPLFPAAARTEMIRETTAHIANVEVVSFEGLLVTFAQERGARVIVRGIRAISDYETELQMALLNRRMLPELETIFLMASEENSFISSRMLKEIYQLGGDISKLAPRTIVKRLQTERSGRIK